MEDISRIWAEELRRQTNRAQRQTTTDATTPTEEAYRALFRELREAKMLMNTVQEQQVLERIVTLRAREAADELTKDDFSAILETPEGRETLTSYVRDTLTLLSNHSSI